MPGCSDKRSRPCATSSHRLVAMRLPLPKRDQVAATAEQAELPFVGTDAAAAGGTSVTADALAVSSTDDRAGVVARYPWHQSSDRRRLTQRSGTETITIPRPRRNPRTTVNG